MNSPESLRDFTSELIRQGLPAEYAHRAAEEFADHHRDLAEELQVAGMDEATATALASERLGDTDTLVKNTVRAYQSRHWCGRWPVLTFLFGPLVLLLATCVVTGLGLVLLGKTLAAIGLDSPLGPEVLTTTVKIAMYCFVGWFVFVLPTAVLFFLSRQASRAGLSWHWIVLAALIIALNIGSMKFGFVGPLSKFADTATGQALAPDRIVVSIPLWALYPSPHEISNFYASDAQQLAQLLLPLLVAALLIWRKRHVMHCSEQSLGSAC